MIFRFAGRVFAAQSVLRVTSAPCGGETVQFALRMCSCNRGLWPAKSKCCEMGDARSLGRTKNLRTCDLDGCDWMLLTLREDVGPRAGASKSRLLGWLQALCGSRN